MKKGSIAWEYIAAFALALLIIIIIIIFSIQIKEKLAEGVSYFITKILGR